jgi:GT2 family glycosyltransferase
MNAPPVAVKVSCLLVNYFSAKHMAQALQSVLQQQLTNAQFQISLDVVVVDNSCNVQEAARLHELVKQLQDEVTRSNSERPHVQVLVNPQNTGFGEGNNLAFKHCQGSLVMLLNPDARMQPNCLLELTSAMLMNDKLGACCPMQYWDHSQPWQLPPAWLPTGIGTWALTKAHQSTHIAQRVSNAYRNLALQSWRGTRLTPQRAISGGAMMLKRSAVESGLFDTGYFMYFEDSDLCLRLKQQGWQLGLVPQAGLVHAWRHAAGKVDMMEASKAHYFASHFNGLGQWQKRLENAQACNALDNPLNARAAPLESDAFQLAVPAEWQTDWLLEASPSPLFTPSAGYFGTGSQAMISKELLMRMSFQAEGSGAWHPAYVRLGPGHKTRQPLQVFKLDLN